MSEHTSMKVDQTSTAGLSATRGPAALVVLYLESASQQQYTHKRGSTTSTLVRSAFCFGCFFSHQDPESMLAILLGSFNERGRNFALTRMRSIHANTRIKITPRVAEYSIHDVRSGKRAHFVLERLFSWCSVAK